MEVLSSAVIDQGATGQGVRFFKYFGMEPLHHWFFPDFWTDIADVVYGSMSEGVISEHRAVSYGYCLAFYRLTLMYNWLCIYVAVVIPGPSRRSMRCLH